MKDSDYNKLGEWLDVGGGLTPFNGPAYDLMEQSHKGNIFTFIEVTARDLKFHRCYMSLINYIWDKMPNRFKKQWPKQFFYRYLKHLKGQFEIIGKIENVILIEYESIAFGRMSQSQFETFIRDQLPWIYSEVIGKYYKPGKWRYNRIIDDIETEYEKFLSRL